MPASFCHALLFLLIFYYIGKKLNFEGNYIRLALLTYAGVITFYSLFGLLPLAGQIEAFGPAFLAEFEQQAVGYLVSALASFGILFGGLSLAFLRVRLPYLRMPPIELMAYRRISVLGAISFLTSLVSPILSGFVAALFLQERLLPEDQFYFLRYYFSGTDPLYVNYIIYPIMFVILIYYLGMRTNFNRLIIPTLLYLFLGGMLGYLIGSPLGMNERIFFNPPSPASSIHLPNFGTLLVTSLYQGMLVTLLGLSVLTIALLRRQVISRRTKMRTIRRRLRMNVKELL